MSNKKDVSENWSAQCFEYNKGILVGGPFDGSEHSVLFFPGDYNKGHIPSREFLEIHKVFSKKFPEGAIYQWNKEKKEWQYAGQMDGKGQRGANKLFNAFKIQPAENFAK